MQFLTWDYISHYSETDYNIWRDPDEIAWYYSILSPYQFHSLGSFDLYLGEQKCGVKYINNQNLSFFPSCMLL